MATVRIHQPVCPSCSHKFEPEDLLIEVPEHSDGETVIWWVTPEDLE